MACRIENVQDEKLRDYIDKLGAEKGTQRFLVEHAQLIKQFEPKEPIKVKDISELHKSLGSYNAINGTNHSLLIRKGGEDIPYGSKKLSDSAKYEVKMNIDYGDSLKPEDNRLNAPSLESIGDEDPTRDAMYFLNAEDINPREFDTKKENFDDPTLNDYHVFTDVEEDALSSFMDPEQLHTRYKIRGTNFGQDSGIMQVLSQATAKIEDIQKSLTRLNTNKSILNREIGDLKKKGVSDSSEDILSRIKRRDAIEDKMRSQTASMKEFKTQILDMGSNPNNLTIPGLRKLFDFHKDFAMKIANAKDPSWDDINIAYQAMKMWKNAPEMVMEQGDIIHPDVIRGLKEISTGATDEMFNKLEAKAIDLMTKESNEKLSIILDGKDFRRAQDISYLKMALQKGSDTPIKILSVADGVIKRANLKTQGETIEVRRMIKNMFDELAKNKLKPEMFMAYDKDGEWTGKAIGRNTPEFYDDWEKSKVDFETEMDNAMRIKKPENKLRDQKLALNKRNDYVRSRMITINPEELLTESGRKRIEDKLASASGDREYAKDRIIDAQMKYDQYKRDFERKKQFYKDQFADGDIKSEKELKSRIDNWERNNSPVELSKYISQKDVGKDLRLPEWSDIERYTTHVPKDKFTDGSPTNYYNQDFKDKILSNPKAFQFYNDHFNLMQRLLSYLPSYAKRGLSPTFLASVKDTEFNILMRKNGRGILAGAKKEFMDSLTTSTHEQGYYQKLDQYGNVKRNIPVQHIGGLDIMDRSRNLKEMAYKFAETSIAYKHISTVEPLVTLMNSFLREMKKPDGSIGGLPHAKKMLQHIIDNNIYGDRFNTEFVTGAKSFDNKKQSFKVLGEVNDIPIISEYNNLVKSIGVEEATKKMSEKYKDHVVTVNEKTASRDIDERMSDLEDLRDNKTIGEVEYEKRMNIYKEAQATLGRNFTISKMLDQTMRLGYKKTFMFQFFPAFGNEAYGVISILNHGSARQDYNPSDARWAIMQAHKDAFRSIRADSLENNKTWNWAQILGVHRETMEAIYKAESYDLSILGPMGLMNTSEYLNRTGTMNAMLKSTKIKDLKGNERSLWDARNADGTWNTAEFADSKEWNGHYDDPEANKEHFKFAIKVAEINAKLHGNMDRETMPEAKRHILGRMLSMYKASWAVEGIDDRFGERRYSEPLGRNVEGRYRTVFNMFKDNGFAKSTGALVKLLAFQGEGAFKNIKMRDVDKQMLVGNIRKTMKEMHYMLGLTAAYMGLSAAVVNDNEDKTKIYLAMNSTYKLMGDMSFYFSPGTFNQFITNPIPAASVFTDFGKLMYAFQQYVKGDNAYYDESKLMENFTRQFPVLNAYNKWNYNTDRILANVNH
jgi:hypothetical protein